MTGTLRILPHKSAEALRQRVAGRRIIPQTPLAEQCRRVRRVERCRYRDIGGQQRGVASIVASDSAVTGVLAQHQHAPARRADLPAVRPPEDHPPVGDPLDIRRWD